MRTINYTKLKLFVENKIIEIIYSSALSELIIYGVLCGTSVSL